jgi:hypothetical protein
MKGLFTLFHCILFQIAFGQFGVIDDKDGFVKVRSSPNTSNNVIDTLKNGQIVFCFQAEGEWSPTDYDLSRQNKSGYIHNSRLRLIDEFEKISYDNLTDSFISFKKDSIKLIITKTKFNPKNHDLEYHKGDASKNEIRWLEKINGKEIWGTDGNVPQNQYGQITLTVGKEKINLPVDNLFEPNLDFTTVNIDSSNRTIYISSVNGDGAGGYAVLWIIENGTFDQRITTIPF